MTGYKIYLTKSFEVSSLLSRANQGENKPEGVQSVGNGMVNKDCRIPSLYHDKGYFYCILEYRGLDTPKYEVIFA